MTILFDPNLNLSFISINPLKVNFNDINNSTRLYVYIKDNLSCNAEIIWDLTDDNGVFTMSGRSILDGSNYITWSGDNNYPFSFIVNLLNLTIIE